jgi:hypothetical protein
MTKKQYSFGIAVPRIYSGTQHAYEFLERFQPGAHGRTHPFLQVVAGPLGLPVKPEQLKGFFEE